MAAISLPSWLRTVSTGPANPVLSINVNSIRGSQSHDAHEFPADNAENDIAKYIARIQADDGNSNDTYHFGPVSLAQLFGVAPSHWLVWVGHSTGVNLNGTGSNHVITYQGIYATAS